MAAVLNVIYIYRTMNNKSQIQISLSKLHEYILYWYIIQMRSHIFVNFNTQRSMLLSPGRIDQCVFQAYISYFTSILIH